MTVTDQTGQTSAVTTTKIMVLNAAVETDPFNPQKSALFVSGTPGNDKFSFMDVGHNTISIKVNNISVGTFSTSGKIFIEGLGGHDVITTDKTLRDRIVFL